MLTVQATQTLQLTQNLDDGLGFLAAQPANQNTTFTTQPISQQAPSGTPMHWIGQYQVISLLGQGGTACVYKVITSDGIIGALKVFSETTHRSVVAAEKRHPALMDKGVYHGQDYIVLPYIEGGSYKDILASQTTLPPLKDILLDCIQSVINFHATGFVHRDISPDNLYPGSLQDYGAVTHPGEEYESWVGKIMFCAPELTHFIQESRIGSFVYQYTHLGIGIMFADKNAIPYLFNDSDNMRDYFFQDTKDSFGRRFGRASFRSDQYSLGRSLMKITIDYWLRTAREEKKVTPETIDSLFERACEHLGVRELVPVLQKATSQNPFERYTSVSEFRADAQHSLNPTHSISGVFERVKQALSRFS